MSNVDRIRDLIKEHERRLRELEFRQAKQGIGTDPATIIEIEDIKDKVKKLRIELSKFEPDGKKLVDLLNSGLHNGLLLWEDVSPTYQIAENKMLNEPDVAIDLCKGVLKNLNKTSSADLKEAAILKFSRGKIAFLLAAIYLNKSRDNLTFAVEHFRNSRNEFYQWPQLRAIAFLGSAIAYRKQSKLKDAKRECKFARNALQTPPITSTTTRPALLALKRAIEEETEVIKASGSIEPKRVIPTTVSSSKRVFNAVTGARIITKKTITEFNLLGYGDYLNYETQASQDLILDNLDSFAGILVKDVDEVSYILEVPQEIKTSDGIKPGDRILISEETDIRELNDKRVIVLIIDDPKKEHSAKPQLSIHITMKTLFEVGSKRYFLEAQDDKETSFLITQFQTSKKVISHYKAYKASEKVENKVFYQVRVCGEVKGIIRQGTFIKLRSEPSPRYIIRDMPTISKLPVVDNIAAGLKSVISNKDVDEYLLLNEDERNDADFGVRVKGNSMKDFGIVSDDIALILRQKKVKNYDFAAVVIKTPNIDQKIPLGVLKKYYLVDKNLDDRRHIFLESGNSSENHIVIMEPNTSFKIIKEKYEKLIAEDKISQLPQFLEEAEVDIAGKCVGVVRETKEKKKLIYHTVRGQLEPYNQ